MRCFKTVMMALANTGFKVLLLEVWLTLAVLELDLAVVELVVLPVFIPVPVISLIGPPPPMSAGPPPLCWLLLEVDADVEADADWPLGALPYFCVRADISCCVQVSFSMELIWSAVSVP